MDSLKYLDSLKPSYISLGLERLETLKDILPFSFLSNNVIVAGTNGKGSTCAFLSSILSKCGLKTGFFSSPHLIDPNERIRIDGKPISPESLDKYTFLLKDILEKNKKELTYFEFLTILALWFFKDNETDVNILEVGLGGRLDATNIAPAILTIITSISHDHTKVLGNTLKKIAKEKAGIIKNGIPVLISRQKPASLNVIKDESKIKNAKLFEISKESRIRDIDFSREGISFECKTRKSNYKIFTPYIGEYQIENSTLAILASEILSEILEFPLTPEAVEKGVSSTEWTGRFKKYHLNGRPIFLDGAHNLSGMKALVRSIKKLKIEGLEIGFSALKDKNPKNLLETILPFSSKTYLFCLPSERGMKFKDWERLCKKIKIRNYEIVDLKNFEKFVKEKNIQLFTGSLFFIGEVLKCLKK